ncbi:MAG TPA: type II toxin-antitoxin system Phd/YefM family antitoxin [Thermoanaerobaculia bacterium]|nr:type II toxin-antitoxin system Phd/YefM family antitoxin [Thermoanaerobaculia bacterium]
MSETVNIYEAKTRLSQLVDRAAEGEEVIIARAGRPVARLVPLRPAVVERKPGRMRGRIRMSRSFDDPLPEFENLESDLD